MMSSAVMNSNRLGSMAWPVLPVSMMTGAPFIFPGMMSPAEIQQLWKEVASQSGLEDSMKNTFNGVHMPSSLAGGLPVLPTSSQAPPTSTWSSNGIAENYLSQGN